MEHLNPNEHGPKNAEAYKTIKFNWNELGSILERDVNFSLYIHDKNQETTVLIRYRVFSCHSFTFVVKHLNVYLRHAITLCSNIVQKEKGHMSDSVMSTSKHHLTFFKVCRHKLT